ncbi:MAG TPA: hypothetical protein VF607_02880 [Verrucomicrobiae bacterium]
MNTNVLKLNAANLRRSALNQLRAGEHFNYREMVAAINQAEVVAWETPFPQLFLPVIAEEKAIENARLHGAWYQPNQTLALAA